MFTRQKLAQDARNKVIYSLSLMKFKKSNIGTFYVFLFSVVEK